MSAIVVSKGRFCLVRRRRCNGRTENIVLSTCKGAVISRYGRKFSRRAERGVRRCVRRRIPRGPIRRLEQRGALHLRRCRGFCRGKAFREDHRSKARTGCGVMSNLMGGRGGRTGTGRAMEASRGMGLGGQESMVGELHRGRVTVTMGSKGPVPGCLSRRVRQEQEWYRGYVNSKRGNLY